MSKRRVNENEINDNIDKIEENKNNYINSEDNDINIQSENKIEEEIYESKEQSQIAEYKEKNKVKSIIMVSIISAILIIFFSFVTIICINKVNANAYKNIYILGNNLSGMTSEEVVNFLNDNKTKFLSVENLDIYQNLDKIYSIKPEDIEFEVDISKTAKAVMNFGRSGNIINDNIEILKALFKKKNVDIEYTYNNDKLEDVIKNIDLSVENRFVDDTYNVDEANKKIIIINGVTGNSIDYANVKENIISSFINSKNIYKLEIIQRQPASIDTQKVYENVKRDPKDAYIDESSEPDKFVPEQVGFDFDINKLKEILDLKENKEEGKTIEFALNVIEPKVKLSDITYKLYNDKITGVTTYFDPGQKSRVNNLEIALRYLNGKIIMPGEVFSYNSVIGDTTAAKGYLSAATFKAGKVVMELGGGICQTTSTLYDAVLKANLQIVERHQHGLPVGYIPPSLDATVYSPVLDFKFKNTRKYPVKIVTSFSYGGSLNISIYGTKEETEYDIQLTHKYISTIPFSTKYIYDASLPSNKQVVDVNGVNGYVSEGYITKKLNGKIVSTTMLSRDTYNPQQKVVRIGTGNVNNPTPGDS